MGSQPQRKKKYTYSSGGVWLQDSLNPLLGSPKNAFSSSLTSKKGGSCFGGFFSSHHPESFRNQVRKDSAKPPTALTRQKSRETPRGKHHPKFACWAMARSCSPGTHLPAGPAALSLPLPACSCPCLSLSKALSLPAQCSKERGESAELLSRGKREGNQF